MWLWVALRVDLGLPLGDLWERAAGVLLKYAFWEMLMRVAQRKKNEVLESNESKLMAVTQDFLKDLAR